MIRLVVERLLQADQVLYGDHHLSRWHDRLIASLRHLTAIAVDNVTVCVEVMILCDNTAMPCPFFMRKCLLPLLYL
ncbi:hypothetical protein C0J52_13442 [Blattella germanica]|nr:hypothetical protein C0J52_13442 [Blattella germanica]